MVLSKRSFVGCLDQVFSDIKLLLLVLHHDSVKELLHAVCVPLADCKLLRNLLIFIKQLNDRVGTPHILDGKARIPRWSLALDERRNLRVRPQTSSAHLKDRPFILDIVKSGGATIVSAASLTIGHHNTKLKHFRSWQEEHSSFAELKPRSRHLAASTASAPAAEASATRNWLSSSRQPSIVGLLRTMLSCRSESSNK